jgi:lactose/raffinose/galactose permease
MYAFYLPAALMIFSAIVFAWKITLTEKKHAQIVKELEQKLTAADSEELPAGNFATAK